MNLLVLYDLSHNNYVLAVPARILVLLCITTTAVTIGVVNIHYRVKCFVCHVSVTATVVLQQHQYHWKP